MQFSSILFAAVALIGSAAAKPQFTNSVFNNVTAGEPFTFTWANATGPVTITLMNGPELKLEPVEVISSGLSGGSYTWNVPATLPADTYAFRITDSSPEPNYSIRFQLIGGVTSTSSSVSTASSNGTSTSTRSSASTTSESATTSTGTSTRTTGTATQSTTSSTSSSTSAPSGNMAAGLGSNLAFVFLAVGALMTLN